MKVYVSRVAASVINACFWVLVVAQAARTGHPIWAFSLAAVGLFTIAPARLIWRITGDPYTKGEHRQLREAQIILGSCAALGIAVAIAGFWHLSFHHRDGVILIVGGLLGALIFLLGAWKLPARISASSNTE